MGSRTEIYLFSILILQALAIPIFAEENIDDSKSVMLETDKPEYQVGEMIIISGFVEEKKMPVVALRIFDPYGGILSAHQLEIESGNTFSKTILLDSPFYDDEGDYTISVNYGKLQAETNFKMVAVGQDESLVDEDSQTLFPEIIVMFTDKEVYQDGVNFKTEGTYSISAFYGDSEEVTNFEFVKPNKNKTPIEEKKTSDDIKSSKPNEKITEDKNDEPALSNNNIKNPPTNPSKNLSVEDIELGLMLNQINLKCDRNEFVDTISYYDGMGPALIRLCRYSDAIFYYDQSLLKEPNNVDILTNKGSALAKMGLYEEAIKYYNSALAVNPTNYFTLNNKANALANLGNFQEAFSLYKKALDVSGDNPIVLQNLEKALDKSITLQIKNEPIILKNDTQPQDSIMESEKNLIKTSNQQTENIFEQLGSILSSIGNSIFSFLS